MCLVLMAITSSSFAQNTGKPVKFMNPATVPAAKGYSQAAEIDLGTSKMLLISGQVSFDKTGELVGKLDFTKQAEQAFINIKNIVEAAGGSMNDLVKLNFYLLDTAHIVELRKVRDQFINTVTPPTSTLVQVSKLFRDDVLVEIEATAVIAK